MTSGEIKFYIEGVECPNTSGVGVNAVGGVFNCGLVGTTFEAVCTTTCSPFMSIVEVFIWQELAMTLFGSQYYVPDSGPLAGFPNDPNKLLNTGSYWYNAFSNNLMYNADRGGSFDSRANCSFEFSETIVIKRAILLAQGHGPNQLTVGSATFTKPLDPNDSGTIWQIVDIP